MTAVILSFPRRPQVPEPDRSARELLASLPLELAARYVLDGDCLRWTGPTNGRQGYGLVIGRVLDPEGNRVQAARMAHRATYEAVHGPIPAGLVLDHYRVGTTAPCIGPPCGFHVVPSTVRENTLRDGSASITAANIRKIECVAGHPYDEVNTYVRPTGYRECRTCRANWRNARRAGGTIELFAA